MKTLLEFQDKKAVKIITGICRCGKSSLLQLFIEHLKQNGVPPERIIHMNFESIRHKEIADFLALYNFVANKITSSGKTYIFLDEMQMVKDWARRH